MLVYVGLCRQRMNVFLSDVRARETCQVLHKCKAVSYSIHESSKYRTRPSLYAKLCVDPVTTP